MSTYKQIVNKVLRKLRETELGASDTLSLDSYWTLIGDFVNDAKREVEDAWNWTDLRTTLSLTATSGSNTLVLTGTNPRTKILGVFDTANDIELLPFQHSDYNRLTLLQTQQSAGPVWYRRRGVDDSTSELRLELYPKPNSAYAISVYCKVPQADLSSESTSLSLAGGAEDAIVLRAWAAAISERGEDGGASYDEVMIQYRKALEDAIALDLQDTLDETSFVVV